MNDLFFQDINNALLGNYKNRTGKVKVRRMKRKLHLLKIQIRWILSSLWIAFENQTGIARIKANRFFREVA